MFPHLNGLVLSLLFLLVILMLWTVVVFRTRIGISHRRLVARRFRTRTVDLPERVRVERFGLCVALVSLDGEMLFRFHRYLGHSGSLQSVLEEFFA